MNSFSEKSFGARLLRAQNLLQTIQGFNAYTPPQAEDSAVALGNLLDDITEANDNEMEEENAYVQAVQSRQDAFWKDSASLTKLLSPLRAAVEAQYNKDSHEYENVMKHIHEIRSHGGLTPTASVADGQDGQGGEQSPKPSISQSEQSYGSLHRHFADLVLTLEKLNGFNPSNTKLQTANLKAFLTELETMHNDVINKENALRQQRNDRLALYEELSQRVKRIKAYVQAQYGAASLEYAAVKAVEL